VPCVVHVGMPIVTRMLRLARCTVGRMVHASVIDTSSLVRAVFAPGLLRGDGMRRVLIYFLCVRVMLPGALIIRRAVSHRLHFFLRRILFR
jgi:hypothetical protein